MSQVTRKLISVSDKPRKCSFCGESPVFWAQYETTGENGRKHALPDYRLAAADGTIHVCPREAK